MDRAATERYLRALSARGMKPGLERMRALMLALGNPEARFRAVHVTGTNGKGSVCALLESAFRHSGRKTGLYTSPHLVRLTERIRIGGRPVPERAFDALIGKVRAAAIQAGIEPDLTYFEAVTAAAFLQFARAKVDVAVVEIGLGGRLDATNVIPPPDLCVITNIALEHTEYLGNTVQSIAAEKAGIVKSGSVCLTGAEGAALRVIRKACRERGVALERPGPSDRKSALFRFARRHSKLRGGFQEPNLLLAARAVEILRRRGWRFPDAGLRRGFSEARWPGRFDWRTLQSTTRKTPVLLDGAHNPAAVDALVGALKHESGARKPCELVFNVLKDKDAGAMADSLARALKIDCVHVPRLGAERASAPERIVKIFRGRGFETRAWPGVPQMWRALRRSPGADWILVTGSLYLVGASLRIFSRRIFE